MSVYQGVMGHGYTTDWTEVDCAACLAKAPAGVVPPTLQDFYVTFGMMYRYEKHPHWPAAHPDGWLRVQAPDEEAARLLVRKYIGNVYAFMYEGPRFDSSWHPVGELACISPDGATASREGIDPPALLPEVPATKKVRVSWQTTESFSADIEVDVDFDLNGENAEEDLLDLICNGDYESATSDAFDACIDRSITDKEWA